jgi:hypothetical protein
MYSTFVPEFCKSADTSYVHTGVKIYGRALAYCSRNTQFRTPKPLVFQIHHEQRSTVFLDPLNELTFVSPQSQIEEELVVKELVLKFLRMTRAYPRPPRPPLPWFFSDQTIIQATSHNRRALD